MNRILLCSDGSDYAEVATRYAAWLAKSSAEAAITALYVSDLRQFEVPVFSDLGGSLGVQSYQGVAARLQEMENDKANLIREAVQKAISEEGWDGGCDFLHRTGLLVDTLENIQRDYDVVVLGKRGETANLAKGHLGSNMERVIRASEKPVLVTNRAFKRPESLVLAYDGGPSCRKALEFLQHSTYLRDLKLHAVTVAEDGEEELASQRLELLDRRLSAAGYEAECQMLNGEVGSAISKYVENRGIDLLMMGAYGHSRIRYLLIGSTTTEMIRGCRVPVFCFR
jgi:nucleotide-binding universal stress UspA family protein